jgi:hypothetical protein
LEFGDGFVLAVISEVEGPEVNSDAGGGADFFVGADGVRGRNVNRAHEPLRTISPDGNEGEANFWETVTNFGEVRAVSGVSGEENRSGRGFDDVAGPESAVAIAQPASGEMAGRNGGDADGIGKLGGLPPIEFGDLGIDGNFFGDQSWSDAERNSEVRFPLAHEAAESGHVEMVVMIVALQYEMNFGEMFEANAGRAMASGTGKRNRAGALRPDGIEQDVDSFELQQDGGVADEGGANGTVIDAFGRNGAGRSVYPLAPRTGLAIGQPLEQAGADARLAARRIVEMFAVEMVGRRAAIKFHAYENYSVKSSANLDAQRRAGDSARLRGEQGGCTGLGQLAGEDENAPSYFEGVRLC